MDLYTSMCTVNITGWGQDGDKHSLSCQVQHSPVVASHYVQETPTIYG
jgi:hypothetical protein